MMKKSDDLFSCFDTIPACDTDRRQTSCHRIVRAYAKHRAVKNIILISFVPSHSMFTVTGRRYTYLFARGRHNAFP